MLEWTVKLPFEILIFPQFWTQECFPFYIEADGPLTCSVFYSCWRTYCIMQRGAHLVAYIFPLKGVWGSFFFSHALAFDLRLNQGILCMGCFVWISVIAIFIFEPESRYISQKVHAHICEDAVSTSHLRNDLHLGKSWRLSVNELQWFS